MKRPIESDYTSQVAYTRALEEYCDTLAQPKQAPVAWHVYFGNEDEPNYVCIGEKPVDAKAVIRPLVFGDTTPPQRKPLTITEESAWDLARYVYARSNPHESPQILLIAMEIKQIIEAAHGIKE